MRRFIRWILILSIVSGLGYAATAWARAYLAERAKPHFKMVRVESGEIAFNVNSTGTVKPVKSVAIGSFVSGPIAELLVDYNDQVKQNQLLARIDTKLTLSAVRRDEANLAVQRAEIERVQALLQHAVNDEKRSIRLRETNKDFISDSEMDTYRFNRMQLDAQLVVAQASVKQAEASLANSSANLGYADIKSPVDGIVIERKVDLGQTLAASFQTPELFVIAPDMDQEMHVFAAVDEADIGFILDAQRRDQPVTFTVDAYTDLFVGSIYQVRKSSTTTQNVVTYPVVVSTPNPELKLLPGMTANLSFQIEKRDKAIKIPNSALRFYPLPAMVRPADRHILELTDVEPAEASGIRQSAFEKAEAARNRNHRHVWVPDEEGLLRALPVIVGLSDAKFSELVSGDIQEGQELVSRVETAVTDAGASP